MAMVLDKAGQKEVVPGPPECACGCGKPPNTNYHATEPGGGGYRMFWFYSPECRDKWCEGHPKARVF